MNIGWNEPYAAAKGVSYTLDHHGEGLAATMIEIRHDEILEPAGVAQWADRLARCLEQARVALAPTPLTSGVPIDHLKEGLDG
jgi:predicted N-formylglutamate amidohydrolase